MIWIRRSLFMYMFINRYIEMYGCFLVKVAVGLVRLLGQPNGLIGGARDVLRY